MLCVEALAEALNHLWAWTLSRSIEIRPAPAQGASGNHAGVFRPLPALDDSRLARLLRAGFLLGHQQFSTLPNARLGWTGALHISRDLAHETTQRRIVTEHQLPADFCRFVEREEASTLAGWPVELGGWWFPQAGWINPPSLCRALLEGIEVRYGQRIETLDGIDADEIVIANGIDAPVLVPDLKLPIRVGRGLVSHVPEAATPPFNIVATRLGYVTPAVDGIRCAGATMASGDHDPAPRLEDHIENLHRLDMLLPGFGKNLDPTRLDGRVSFRPMSPDRLPIVGPLVANEGLWIIDGFGARGLVFASICAELLASQIGDEPLPLEADLVAAVAHELKTPLTTIKGFVSVILSGEVGPLNEQQTNFLNVTDQSVNRLTSLITNLLDLSRLGGKVEMELGRVDLAELVRVSVSTMLLKAKEGSVDLRNEAPRGLPQVNADTRWISQVIDNLVINAIKYAGKGAQVKVTGVEKGEVVVVCVEDNGPGIPAEEQKLVFDKFYRGRTSVNQVPGTGLGLAISKSVVEKHGGKIWLESKPGKGCKFCFALPVAKTPKEG